VWANRTMKAATSLRIELKASYVAAALIFLAIVGTCALVAWLPGSGWLRGAAVIALGIYGIGLERTWALRSARRAIVDFTLRPDLTVTLVERAGRIAEGVVLGDSFVAAMLTTLVVRVPRARWPRTVAILPDMLPAEDFRRLRVQLRLGRVPPAQAAAATTEPSAPVSGVAATPARR
jgi:Membrane-bound toxin component of toxin-antitoxin system